MPWIGRSRGGHVFNVALLCCVLGGAALLTVQALYDDHMAKWTGRTEANSDAYDASVAFLSAQLQAELEAERVLELADSPAKIPPTGALSLVYDDPYLQGPKLFRQHCANCHNYVDRERPDAVGNIANKAPTAPNLYGVGSRQWLQGLLDPEQISGPDHFGYAGSPFVGDGENTDMVDFVREAFGEAGDDDLKRHVQEALEKVAAALSAEAQLPEQAELDERDQALIAEGRALMEGGLAEIVDNGMSCTDCHSFGTMQDIGSPVLDGYMSRAWLMAFIRNPADERFYGEKNDRMPAFAPHDNARLNQLDEKSLGLLVDWLRGDWYRAGAASKAQ
jgi:ubiquinol-cytochrome c reductase cytochrome b subunit